MTENININVKEGTMDQNQNRDDSLSLMVDF